MTRPKTKKLIRKKAQQVLAAERQYWARHDSLLRRFDENAAIAGVPPIKNRQLVSRVFGFRDACVLVRFQRLPGHDFQVLDIDAASKDWQQFVSIPVEHDGNVVEIRVGNTFGIGGILINCTITFVDSGSYEIPYLQMVKCEYGDNPDL